MTESEAKEMLEAKLQCMILEDLSCVEKGCDRNCDDCDCNYMQGTVGEQKEALRIAINTLEKQSKIEKYTRLFEQTFDWGCNDTAKMLYANAVYSVISGKEIFAECEQEFLEYMAER